jgi:hypothetical protein
MNVDITIDGENLDMNDFVQRMVFEVNKGILNTLHNISEWSKVEIRIEK